MMVDAATEPVIVAVLVETGIVATVEDDCDGDIEGQD